MAMAMFGAGILVGILVGAALAIVTMYLGMNDEGGDDDGESEDFS